MKDKIQLPVHRVFWVSVMVSISIVLVYSIMVFVKYQRFPLDELIYGFLYTFLATFLIYSLNLILFQKLIIKYPWNKNAVKRLIIEFILTSILSIILIFILAKIFYWVFPHYLSNVSRDNRFNGFITALITNTIVMCFNEGVFILSEWKKSLVAEEYLKRKNIEMQYQVLSSQVNPHFLFNSLNALTSLIKTDQTKAIEFTMKFSDIYRYVLNVKDKVIVELSEEISFFNSYMYLQKIRYGDNLNYTILIDANYLNMFVPPLSLQMLAENSIKHNIISNELPLHILIKIENNYIVLENSYNPRMNESVSTKIGQKNIKERYFEISELLPEFYTENDKYISKLPLLDE